MDHQAWDLAWDTDIVREDEVPEHSMHCPNLFFSTPMTKVQPQDHWSLRSFALKQEKIMVSSSHSYPVDPALR